MIAVLVGGTWADSDDAPWWRPSSPFARMLAESGHKFPPEPFRWTTKLDGILGENSEWARWGMALTWFCHKHSGGQRVNLIAHSHGGQVAAYALSVGLRVNALITVATPVRRDMLQAWETGTKNLRRWSHIHSDGADWWQWLGARLSGWLIAPREMPAPAENIYEPGRGHSELLVVVQFEFFAPCTDLAGHAKLSGLCQRKNYQSRRKSHSRPRRKPRKISINRLFGQ